MSVLGPLSLSSCMSMGSMRDCLASSIAFSAVPPMPMPSMPGGHQPAPMVGTVLRTQSTTESDGLSMTNLDFASEPPPLAATVTSTVEPGTRATSTTEGVLSTVFLRLKAGSRRMEPRSLLSGLSQARADAFVADLLERERGGLAVGVDDVAVHADLEEDGDDAGVLADGAMTFGAHARVDEDLGHGVFGGGGLLEVVGRGRGFRCSRWGGRS